MHKPTRGARRFLKKSPKGKGKRKGWSRFLLLTDMGDASYDAVFYGRKGTRKGKRRYFGKGKG